METTSTQRANQQSEADRLQQDHTKKIRDLKRQQDAELAYMTEKHDRDIKALDQAYRVEITAKEDEYSKKTNELNSRQMNQLALLAKQNDSSLKQAQETYRAQAEELKMQGERRLAKMREEQVEANENIQRKGNA